MIARKHLGSIRFANGERSMQSKIAGLPWSQDYSIGGKFFEARDALPIKSGTPHSTFTSRIPMTAPPRRDRRRAWRS